LTGVRAGTAFEVRWSVTARSVVLPGRLFHLLASLRVGVVTMVVLAVTCGIATFYESSHGTAAASSQPCPKTPVPIDSASSAR